MCLGKFSKQYLGSNVSMNTKEKLAEQRHHTFYNEFTKLVISVLLLFTQKTNKYTTFQRDKQFLTLGIPMVPQFFINFKTLRIFETLAQSFTPQQVCGDTISLKRYHSGQVSPHLCCSLSLVVTPQALQLFFFIWNPAIVVIKLKWSLSCNKYFTHTCIFLAFD